MEEQEVSGAVTKARNLGEAIAGAADAIESTRRIPGELMAQMHESSLFRMLLPASSGGDQTAPHHYVLAIEELARHGTYLSPKIAAFLEPAISRTICGEPFAILAWGPPNGSRAIACASAYRVSGTWDFASGHRDANWMGAAMQGLYSVGVAGVALGIARAMLDEFISLARRKTPRLLKRLAESAVVQGDVARAEAKLGAARAYLVETLASIYARADDFDPIDVGDRARVRLACTNAIHSATEVADFTYKAAVRPSRAC